MLRVISFYSISIASVVLLLFALSAKGAEVWVLFAFLVPPILILAASAISVRLVISDVTPPSMPSRSLRARALRLYSPFFIVSILSGSAFVIRKIGEESSSIADFILGSLCYWSAAALIATVDVVAVGFIARSQRFDDSALRLCLWIGAFCVGHLVLTPLRVVAEFENRYAGKVIVLTFGVVTIVLIAVLVFRLVDIYRATNLTR